MTSSSVYSVELAVGMAAVLVWIVLVFFRGGFWRVSGTAIICDCFTPLKPQAGLNGKPVHVAVVMPARNEADVIGRAIGSLLQQSGGAEVYIFLVDDDSTDGTAERAREAARGLGQVDRLTVISAGPLPSGWSGKLWAVRTGVEKVFSDPLKPKAGLNGPPEPTPGWSGPPEYLLLTDADVVHAPESIATLISIAEGGGDYDLVSFMVKLHCVSFAERLLIPAFVYFFFKLYPPRWIASSRHRVAGAAGGCMLVRSQALERAGGIEAIRSEIIDDCALAKRIKASGGRVWLGMAPRSSLKPKSGLNRPPRVPLATSIRPYESFSVIEDMIARTAFNQLRHSTILLVGCVVGLALTYLAPVALLFSGHFIPSLLGLAAFVLIIVSYAPVTRYYGLNPLWALSLPAAALFYMKATVHSAFNYWTNRGGRWKGRAQDRK